MTRRTDKDTQPGPGAVVKDALAGFDADLPEYVFDRAQSDGADAARHHAPARALPAGNPVTVEDGHVSVNPPSEVKTSEGLGTPPKDTLDLAIERARNAPSNTDFGQEQRLLGQLRDGEIGGISTDPGAHAIRRGRLRNTLLLIVFVAGVLGIGLTLALRKKPAPQNDPMMTATQTTTPTAPLTTAPPTTTTTMSTPTQTPTGTPTPTAHALPTIKPLTTGPLTTGATTTSEATSAATAPPTTSAAPTSSIPFVKSTN